MRARFVAPGRGPRQVGTDIELGSYGHEDAVAAGHRQYALSLARRTRSDARMRCPLGAGRGRSCTDTLSRERVDTCVAALSVGRTVAHAVATGSARCQVATGSARGQDRALLHVRRRERCRTRGLARDRSRGNKRADCAQHASLHAMSHGRADTSVVALQVERPKTRTVAGSAALRADVTVPARAALLIE